MMSVKCGATQVSSFSADEFPVESITWSIRSAVNNTLGINAAIAITVRSPSDFSICDSFSFSQITDKSDIFIGKYKFRASAGGCQGAANLALFTFNWNTRVMTFLHPLMNLPAKIGSRVIENAYDPYAIKYKHEIWVAFECVGPHIPGTAACVAPLAGTDRIDLSRLTIPIAGLDSDPNSPYYYSASTPKLLEFKGRLYLYWTAIKIEKALPHRWDSIETRGVEMEVTSNREMWPKGLPGRQIASHSPGVSVRVMAPESSDPYRNISVDTEGLYVANNRIFVLSSVGGTGPDGASSCTKPLDKSPGCFHLEITRTATPLQEGSFKTETLVSPLLPANPVEYPRIVTSPAGETHLMVNTHPVQSAPAPSSGEELATGYLLIPFPFESLRFAQ